VLSLSRAKRSGKGVGVPLVPTNSSLPSPVQLITSKSKTSAKDPISNLRKRLANF
jgi:hypothetical protein